MADTVLAIKGRLGIVEVVSQYLKLEQAGANLKARCPFHNEKTPSFFVSPSRESFYCFGCQKGGDIFTFVEEIEGLDFLGALKVLAERAGVTLDANRSYENKGKDEHYRVLETAVAFYRRALAQSPLAQDYLATRGLTAATIANFNLGYAPDGWRSLFDYLKTQDFSEALMVEAGLVVLSAKQRAGQPIKYDRFRGRIMFPIADSAGRTVGFTGRLLKTVSPTTKSAKYINSPETSLFTKSRLLYGYDRAKVAIRRQNRCILVEGQFDVILSHQAGLAETVAVSGTAVTAEHLAEIKRLTNTLILAFDVDQAGRQAASRTIGLTLAEGFEVKVAVPEGGKDAAEVIQKNPADWITAIEQTDHVLHYLMKGLDALEPDRRHLAHRYKADIYPYVARLRHAIDQAHFVNLIAEKLRLPREVVETDIVAVRRMAQSSHEPNAVSKVAAVLPLVSLEERIVRRLFSFIYAEGDEPHNTSSVKAVKAILGPDRYEKYAAQWAPERAKLVLEVELGSSLYSTGEREWPELLNNLKRELLRIELASVIADWRALESADSAALVDKYLKKCHDLTKQINELQS